MNPLIFHPYMILFSAIIILCIGVYTIARNPEDELSRYFALFVFLLGAGSTMEVIYRVFPIEYTGTIKFFAALTISLWCFGTNSYFLFMLVYAGTKRLLRNPLAYVAIYLPAAAVAYIFLFTDLTFKGYVASVFGNKALPTAWFHVLTADVFVYGIGGAIIVLLAAIREKNPILKKRGAIIFMGSLLPIFAGISTNAILPSFGIIVPAQLTLGFAFFCLFCFYAMRRYSLFVFAPSQAVDTILNTTYSSIIAFDMQSRFSFLNPSACKLLGGSSEEIKKKSPAEFFSKADFSLISLDLLEKENPVKGYETKVKTSSQESRDIRVNGVVLRDKSGAKIGALLELEDITAKKSAENAIRKHADELEKINKFMMGRELEMVQLKKEVEGLKKEVNQLLESSGQPTKYHHEG
jgi:PAS domain S-box-containing protein